MDRIRNLYNFVKLGLGPDARGAAGNRVAAVCGTVNEDIFMSGSIKFKRLLLCCLIAVGITYVSLLVPGTVIAVCSHVDDPVYCPVKAYGFPLLFLADSQSLSPVGSVCRNPV